MKRNVADGLDLIFTGCILIHVSSTLTTNQKDQNMDMTTSIIEALRTNESLETFNSVFAEAHAIDMKIEAYYREIGCVDVDAVVDLTVDGERIHDRLEDLAWELKGEFEAAGVRVESQWGESGDWAIYLSPHSVGNSRTAEFLLTSRLTDHSS
jgi:hypothetical protein